MSQIIQLLVQPLQIYSRAQLNRHLDENGIVNQTEHTLPDAEIEILSLGLNFIPTRPPSTQNKETKKNYALESMLSYPEQVNSNLYWSEYPVPDIRFKWEISRLFFLHLLVPI